MKDTPINYQVVTEKIEASGISNIGTATIREIKKLIDQIEKATGEKIHQDGDGDTRYATGTNRH